MFGDLDIELSAEAIAALGAKKIGLQPIGVKPVGTYDEDDHHHDLRIPSVGLNRQMTEEEVIVPATTPKVEAGLSFHFLDHPEEPPVKEPTMPTMDRRRSSSSKRRPSKGDEYEINESDKDDTD